ncbi:hypothetical protein DY000_02008976 [Brassica cretica]|uniref:No apical meristem-associated C-terminal domain-containing protein n=1 Tax=Brassica cretica TaxID=69181 RepID=A0ABQ7CJ18_BRACR|nr:hypothetical protein DY000_02008976 [Brassica cretica]
MKRNRLSPWLVDEPTNLSLSLRGSSRKRIVFFGGCRRGRKSLIISLSVGLLDGKGLLSLFDSFSRWLSSTATEHSVGGSPQRRQSSLSPALLDSLRDQLAFDVCLEKERSGSFINTASNENNAVVDDDGTCRPPGVRAAKARGKKPVIESKGLSDFQTMWSIKKEDLAMKEKLSKMKLRESLIAKQVPLADYEEALKKKLINELM